MATDRVTVATISSWRHDAPPPVGHLVEIWHGWTIVEAVYDGWMWRTPGGTPIAVDAWWRECQPHVSVSGAKGTR